MQVRLASLRHCSVLALAGGLLGMSGCSGGSFGGTDSLAAPLAGKTTTPGVQLRGSVYGGRQPIAGANVFMFAANTMGHGAASVSLLTSAGNTSLDTSEDATAGDYFVTTGPDGMFSISGDYACTENSQVYLYVLGGDPGAGMNPSAGLMAALGNCPVAGDFAASTPFLAVNEVSTVAAAYAMAGFAKDALHVSSRSTEQSLAGIANAFANAANLAAIGTGTALSMSPGGNGTVPQAEINTLANILAACINSNGTVTNVDNSPTPCYTLFTAATDDGTPTGNQPTDTATAAINIAHNPGANMDSLFGLTPPNAPFLPALAVEPNDFTVALTFSGGGLNLPNRIAIDGTGNAWITSADYSANSVVELSSAGTVLSGASGFSGGGLMAPWGIAIDSSGNAWVTNYTGNSVTVLSNSGSVLAGPYTSPDMSRPVAIAFDTPGNAWIANSAGNSVTELSSGGEVLSGTTGYTSNDLAAPTAIAVDGLGGAWVANSGGSSVSRFSNTGAPLSGQSGYTGGGLIAPNAIALDGSGNAWAVNQFGLGSFGWGSITELSNNGALLSGASGYAGGGMQNPLSIAIDGVGSAWVTDASNRVIELASWGDPLSGANGYQTGTVNAPYGIAVDGSGNVWMTIPQSNAVAELVGAAAPAVTPLMPRVMH